MKRYFFLIGLVVSANTISQAQVNDTPQSGPSFVVNALGDTNDNVCGTSNCTLREAINAANNRAGSELIQLAAGLAGTIQLTAKLPVITTGLDFQGPGATILTIRGEGQAELYSIFEIASGIRAHISGLTLTNGSSNYGGGIYNDGGTLMLRNCTLSGNSARFGGGAIRNVNGGTLEITACHFFDNRATDNGDGGAISNDAGSTLTLAQCTLSTNRALVGGAIASGGSLELSNCILSGNSAEFDGGGIYSNNGTLAARNCTISDNSAFVAGGMANRGTATLSACTLSGNRAEKGGGIDNLGTLSLSNCTLSGNSVQDSGYAGASFFAFYGGAINNNSANGTLTLSNCTLSGNNAENGKDIYNERGMVSIGNTILNSGSNRLNGFNTGTSSQGYNISIDGTGPAMGPNDRINTNPRLGPLADNGGATLTHALLPGSPAIDAGNSNVSIDQRGALRPFDGNNDGTAEDDIGAFEFGADAPQSAPNYVVNQTADSDDGACTLSNCTLREAINAANSDGRNSAVTFDTTVFATPQQAITLGGTPLTLYSNGSLNITGPAADVVIDANNQSRIFYVGSFANVRLTGLTISGGSASVEGVDGWGGAILNQGTLVITSCTLDDNNAVEGGSIYNTDGTLVINNSTLSDNSAREGGAIYGFGGTVRLQNCTVSNNDASGVGGGVYNYSGLMVLDSCTLEDNSAGGGGGINNVEKGTLVMRNSTLSGNTAEFGGGIFNSSVLTITDSTVKDNNATGFGGGIYSGNVSFVSEATVTITNSSFTGNSAIAGGGGISNQDALIISNSTLSGNSAQTGGGIYNRGKDGTLSLRSSTLSNNSADAGGAISNAGAALTITNSTLSSNSAQSANSNGVGGAILNTTVLTITSSTLSNNSAVDVGGIYNFSGATLRIGNTILDGGAQGTNLYNRSAGTITSLGYNLSSDAAGGDNTTGPGGFLNEEGDIRNTAPMLGPLADNGGPTQTHALLSGSPAINRIHNYPNTDQRGVTRPQGVLGDIGAYEAIFLSIGDVTIVEGDGGTKNAVFPVTLGTAVDAPVSVHYATVNSSAKSGEDFSPALSDSDGNSPGVLTIPANQTTGSITVPIAGDMLDEVSEVFYVLLSSPVNAVFSKARATGIITDNDAPPSFSINNVIVTEGNTGTRNANFLLRLNRPSGQVVSVDVGSAVSSGGSARAGVDYQFLPRTTISFAPGQTQRIISVAVVGDTLDEDNESFFVNLSNVRDATVSDNQGVGLITDDDQPPALSIGDALVVEGNSGTKILTFTVNLLRPSGKNVSVRFATADGIARAGSDYRVRSGALNFAPGQTTKTISIIVNSDTQVEGDETVYVLLTNATNATVSRGRATGTITNDDVSG